MTEAFDPLHFLSLARDLANVGQNEASLRTAVGRAYYALFLVARDKTGVTEKRKIHRLVIEAIRKRKAYHSTADQLDALRRLRTVADYQLLPGQPTDRDWVRNWARADELANRVLPRLESW